MSKILFIANEPSILALIENLQPLIEPTIEVEADYSNGIKRIFEDQPDVVFFQSTIDNVSCEKPVSQVKALLDQESTCLILLTDDAVSWDPPFSAFDHCLDMYLPLDELSRHIQQLLSILPSTAATVPGAVATEVLNQAETMEVELSSGDLMPFGEFPIETAEVYSRELQALTGDTPPEFNLPTLAALPEEEPPTFLASFLAGQFIEPLPSFVFEDLPPKQASTPAPPLPAPEITQPLALPIQGTEKQGTVGRENPNPLFGSLSQETSKPFAQLAKAAGSGPSGKQTPAQATRQSPSLQQKADDRYGSSSGSVQANKVGLAAGGARKIPLTPAQLSNATAARIGPGKSSARPYRGIVICAGLVVCIASTALAWFYFGESKSRIAQRSSEVSSTSPPKASTMQQLPEFIPRIAPDASYGASHPGWERYRADAVEYLVFREKGEVRAVQVVSEQQGAISVPFLKTCIRTATGSELSEIRFAEARKDGIEVLTGALANGVELAIYRKISDREVRGFVLSFPTEGPARPESAKAAK